MKKALKLTLPLIIIGLLSYGLFYFMRSKATAIEYKVMENYKLDDEAMNMKERGTRLVKKGSSYYLVICYGEQSQYYDSLEVTKVKVSGRKATITVKLPGNPYDSRGNALSYPKAIIKFEEQPEDIKVIYN